MVAGSYALYALALLALWLMWLRYGERHWLLIGLCYAPPLLYAAPLVPLFGAALLLGNKRLLLPSVLLTGAVLAGPFDFQLPRLGTPTGSTSLKVLSYNVRAGLGGDGKGASEKVAAYLKESGADLIGLQESRQPMDQKFSDPTPTITAALSGYHVARGGHRQELVNLSRYPILAQQEHDLNGYSPCLEIVVDVKGQKVRFLNVHVLTGDPKGVLKGKAAGRTDYLRQTATSRHEQTGALVSLIKSSELPTILVGDFNSPPGSLLHRNLSTVLKDSWAMKGFGPGLTYRSDRPLWRIDYLWVSPGIGVESCRVEKSRLSDHKPLGATYRW